MRERASESGWRLPAVISGPILHLMSAVAPQPHSEAILNGPRLLAFHTLHRFFSRGDLVHPKAVVFMSGVPGAGKSTIIERRYQPNSPRWRSCVVVLDLDSELSTHPRYDPANPDKLYFEGGTRAYDWADRRVEARYQAALVDPSVRRIVIDGTGTNAERQTRRMLAASDAGWFVKVLYVHIPVETAVRRAEQAAGNYSATRR